MIYTATPTAEAIQTLGNGTQTKENMHTAQPSLPQGTGMEPEGNAESQYGKTTENRMLA